MQPDQKEILKLRRKVNALLALFVFSVCLGLASLFGFSPQKIYAALQGDYNKGNGAGQTNTLNASDWNNLPNDFVDQSGDSMSGALTIDGSDNSGLRLKALSADTNFWSVYSHKDYGDLNFWHGSDRMTIDKDTGNVGIGVASPSTKLEVNGSAKISSNLEIGGTVKIAGGSPGAGKVLTSNTDGTASWKPVAQLLTVFDIIDFSSGFAVRKELTSNSEQYMFCSLTAVDENAQTRCEIDRESSSGKWFGVTTNDDSGDTCKAVCVK
jgi:hypothetical protein